jgi:hypothetical protein
MLIINELVLAPTPLAKHLNSIVFLPDVTLATERYVDFADAVKFGSDSYPHATKPLGLTSTAVRTLSSLARVET